MQLNQLSCLALGVCFLWGYLRFITSKGARWFYWDIQWTRSTEPFQPVRLCKCICMSWALWGWTCRERNAPCVMSSETDWTFHEHRRSNTSDKWAVMLSHFMQHSLTGSVVRPAHTPRAGTQTFLVQSATAGDCPPVSGATSKRLQRQGSEQTLQV